MRVLSNAGARPLRATAKQVPRRGKNKIITQDALFVKVPVLFHTRFEPILYNPDIEYRTPLHGSCLPACCYNKYPMLL